MNYVDAVRTVKTFESEAKSFRVYFERREDEILVEDMCPDRTETPFTSYAEAVQFGRRLAKATKGRLVNFCIINGKFEPVGQWRQENR